MHYRTLIPTALFSLTAVALPGLQATAGTIVLETAGIAADLNDAAGTPVSTLIGTSSDFSAIDSDLAPNTAAVLVFGDSSVFTEASIDARTVLSDTIDVSGTSRTTDTGDTFHSVALSVTLEAGESFVADGHNVGDDINAFDRVFLSSLQVFDADGVALDNGVNLIEDSRGAPSLSISPGAGTFSLVFSASSPSPIVDDEFDVRFSTVAGVPSPTALAAGLLGLVGLTARRRRTA